MRFEWCLKKKVNNMSYPTYESPYKKEIQVGDKTISLEIGKFSERTSAAVLAQCGETVVHVTVALGNKVDWGYFPLHVEYEEKLYAGGIIKGSRWVKREGHPSADAVLKARIIDRTLRPLFPKGITNQVQIVTTVLSHDLENSDDMVALLAAGVALEISDIPFSGPVTGLRVGYNKQDKSYVINPTLSEQEEIDLDLIVSGSGKSVTMVEAGADEVDEEAVLGGIEKAQQEFKHICQEIEQIKADIGKDKVQLVAEPTAEEQAGEEKITQALKDKFADQIHDLVVKEAKLEETNMDEVLKEMADYLNEKVITDEEAEEVTADEIKSIVQELMKYEGRRMILEEKIRPDGRKPEEIRPLWIEVDVLPRTHGSAMFKRGATQALTVTTLGSPALGQYIEDMKGEEVKRYFHHYNMPPYSVGESGRFGYPKRREIGHGRLAQRALKPMIPSQEEFPYTIRVVSEIMSANGSTSQASICGSTLSLMAAGVPLKKPVAGIAMGLMSNEDMSNYVVLSDIQGLEDHTGDMDFKVAGTPDGITALQMDIKLTGINVDILREALQHAKKGRQHIMDKMMETIKEPKQSLSKFAPKIEQVTIPADRIGELIGPGGKVIKGIIETTGAEIDVDEDEEKNVGIVNISSPDQQKIDAARTIVENMMKEVELNENYTGEVNRIEDYGAFVEILPGRDGLVHISNMAAGYVKNPRDIVNMGDEVEVRVSEIKDDGKIGLSMLSQKEEKEAKRKQRNSRKKGGNNRRNNKRRRH